jgi:predicted MPP superfamily phosphohydrolase
MTLNREIPPPVAGRRSLSRRTFLRAALHVSGGLTLAGAAGMGYACFIEPDWIEIERIMIRIPRLPKAFDGFTIVQMGDFHIGPDNGPKRIRAAVDAALKLEAQWFVLTGDFVTTLSGNEPDILVQELSRLSAPGGVYAVLGNHDWWTDARTVADALDRAGIAVLRNASAAVRRGEEVLFLAGVDDVWEHKADLERALAGVPDDGAAVLLAHEPDYADTVAADGRVVLQLSGHSHGGQVRLPFNEPYVTPLWARKYRIGLYPVGNMQLYVNRGIGMVRPAVRFNCRPEITFLTLSNGG